MKLCWTAFVFWALSVPTVQGVTCSCEGGCGSAGINSADGTKINVAYGKAANISSRFSNQVGKSGPGCMAVNGKTDTTYQPVENNGGSCVHTANTDYNPWWLVDLGLNYSVFNVTIYNRITYQRRLAKGKLYVNAQLCYTFPDDTSSPSKTKFDVTCSTPLIGQMVKFERQGQQGVSDSYLINICEVQVWVCADGHYGSDCQQRCGHCKNSGTCDRVTGVCPGGCDPRWTGPKCNTCSNGSYGSDCMSTCGNCSHGDVCDKVNGACPNGCQPGFEPSNRLCTEACSNGSYGLGCMSTCGNCSHGDVCDKVNGACPNGCQPGFEPSNRLCNETCSNGSYGLGCMSTCGNCSHGDVCDKVNGACPNGCQPGFEPSNRLCNETCFDGSYGLGCMSTCGNCSPGDVCDKVNGACPHGCQPGFYPSDPLCNDICSDGSYGLGCMFTCWNCTPGDVCDKVNGTCPNGCQPGFDPSDPLCKERCSDGRYGQDCKETCGYCRNSTACRHDNGECEEGCDSDHEGLLCDRLTQSPDDTSPAGVIGGVLAAVVVVAILAGVGFILLRRRRSRKEGTSHTTRWPGQAENFTGQLESRGALDRSTNKGAPGGVTSKPSAAVKPFLKPAKDKTDDEHIYANNPAPSSSSNRPRPAGRSSIDSAAPVAEPAALEEADSFDDNGDDDGPVYGNVGNVYAVLKASKPQLDAVQKCLVDRLASTNLQNELGTIPKTVESEPQEAGNLQVNYKKNRFSSILPYDRCRVVLTDGYSEGSATDYINASYITGYQGERKYIAAQGPRNNTVVDMWRMVWQEKLTHIIMLTNLTEAGKPKCYLYWGEQEGDVVTYGPIKVKTTHVESRDNFCIRNFTIWRPGTPETREVTQYHFTSWPDHDAPTTTSLVTFWRYVTARTQNLPVPLLVHCSAGVGRTGTYIGLDIGMEMAVKDGCISVPELVKRLREERTLMVQAVTQYLFLHRALLEAYTARAAVISADRFDVIFPQPITADSANEHIDREFKALMQMKRLLVDCSHYQAEHEDNVTKNRNPDVLPLDNHIVYLTEHEAGRNQYINAVFMPTMHNARGSILTQLPLPSTLVDFWRLVYGNDVTTIVSLSSPNEEENVKPYCQYWPLETTAMVKTGAYTISTQCKASLLETLSSYTLKLEKTGASVPRTVRLLHYRGWTGEVGGNISDMLQLLETLTKSSMDSINPKIVLQCSDGVGKSGLFSALYYVINRMIYDHDVDAFMAVRHVQTVCPHSVASLAQYRYCYEVAQQRLKDMNVYANI